MLVGARHRGHSRINMFTVQYLVSIISRKGEEQADGCYAERELHIEDLLRCRRRVMEGLNLQQGVRVEAT